MFTRFIKWFLIEEDKKKEEFEVIYLPYGGGEAKISKEFIDEYFKINPEQKKVYIAVS